MATRVYESTKNYYGDRVINRISQVIWFVLSIIEILLFFRFFLLLLGASTAGAFTDFIYRVTAPLVAPFQYIVAPAGGGGSELEWATIIAIIVFWIIAWIFIALLDLARPAPINGERTYIKERHYE